MNLDDVKKILRWNDVEALNDGFLINLDITESPNNIRRVFGMNSKPNTLFIGLSDFDHVPLCIKLTKGTSIYEYWTLNRNLHRMGKPAYIEYINPTQITMRYYYNGLKHRDDGPAVEIYENWQATSTDSSITLSAKHAKWMWFLHGIEGGNGRPIVGHMDGFSSTTSMLVPVDSPEDAPFPAYRADSCSLTWIKKNVQDLDPLELDLMNLKAYYRDGTFLNAACDSLISKINHESGPMKVPSFDRWLRDEGLLESNFWNGQFWKNDSIRLIGITHLGDGIRNLL